MRPPGAILTPGESLIATGNNLYIILSMVYVLVKRCILMVVFYVNLHTRRHMNLFVVVLLFYLIFTIFSVWFCMHLLVFKFVEPPENGEKPLDPKTKVKFKIMSLKVKGAMDYAPELVRLTHLSYCCFCCYIEIFHIMGSIFRCCNLFHVKY